MRGTLQGGMRKVGPADEIVICATLEIRGQEMQNELRWTREE